MIVISFFSSFYFEIIPNLHKSYTKRMVQNNSHILSSQRVNHISPIFSMVFFIVKSSSAGSCITPCDVFWVSFKLEQLPTSLHYHGLRFFEYTRPFYRLPLTLGLPDVSLYLISGYASLAGIPQKWTCVLLIAFFRWHTVSHYLWYSFYLVKMVSA